MERRRKIVIFLVVVSSVLSFWEWKKERELLLIGKAIDDPVYDINTVIVKDGKTSKKILTLTNSDPIFSELRHIYEGSYYDLNWSERRKLLKNGPAYEVEFFINDEIYYTVNIYKMEEDQISLIPESGFPTNKDRYRYSPDGKNTYIFVRKEIPHLLGVTKEFKELLKMIISK